MPTINQWNPPILNQYFKSVYKYLWHVSLPSCISPSLYQTRPPLWDIYIDITSWRLLSNSIQYIVYCSLWMLTYPYYTNWVKSWSFTVLCWVQKLKKNPTQSQNENSPLSFSCDSHNPTLYVPEGVASKRCILQHICSANSRHSLHLQCSQNLGWTASSQLCFLVCRSDKKRHDSALVQAWRMTSHLQLLLPSSCHFNNKLLF